MIDWRLFCIVLSVGAACEGASEYVGVVCSNSGKAGVCKRVTDCPPAVEMLKRKHSHDFKRCDWDDRMEVICCPNVTSRNPDDEDGDKEIHKKPHPKDPNKQNRFSNRKCEQACEDIKKQASCVHFNIINGDNALQDEFPHMAALGVNRNGTMSWDCGASIISSKFLLSAAHCFVISVIPFTKVRLGVLKITDTAFDLDIKKYLIHDEYDYNTKYNDIALVEVEQEIQFSEKVRPACLYWDNNDPDDEMWVIGWGRTTIDQEDKTITLQKARVSAVSVNECNSTYRDRTMRTRTIRSSQICAIGNSTDACGGDSGGPLQVENKDCSFSIVGVISYGMGCGGVVPGVYTRVSRYIDWIEKNVWP